MELSSSIPSSCACPTGFVTWCSLPKEGKRTLRTVEAGAGEVAGRGPSYRWVPACPVPGGPKVLYTLPRFARRLVVRPQREGRGFCAARPDRFRDGPRGLGASGKGYGRPDGADFRGR